MAYTWAAVERAMKVADVLLQALEERQPWIRVAAVLGVSARTVRRLERSLFSRWFAAVWFAAI